MAPVHSPWITAYLELLDTETTFEIEPGVTITVNNWDRCDSQCGGCHANYTALYFYGDFTSPEQTEDCKTYEFFFSLNPWWMHCTCHDNDENANMTAQERYDCNDLQLRGFIEETKHCIYDRIITKYPERCQYWTSRDLLEPTHPFGKRS